MKIIFHSLETNKGYSTTKRKQQGIKANTDQILTQIKAFQVGASLFCYIQIHIKKEHRMSKVLSWAWIEHEYSIMSHGAV